MSGLSHLDELEAEAIYIMREVAAQCEKPVMLYSIGKDSSVMLHLALKAFYPEVPISVDASACAGVTPQSHKNALEAMKMCQIDIVNE